MSDRYKNEPLNTPEQKAYEKALNKIRELEAKLTEKEALLKEAKEMAEFYGNQNNYGYFQEYKVAEHWNVLRNDWDFGSGEVPEYNKNKTPLVFGGKRAREFLAKLKAGGE